MTFSAPMLAIIAFPLNASFCDYTLEMATTIENWSKTEVRGVIRFLNAKGIKPSDIYRELITVYGIDVMGKTQVYDWCRKFSEGRSSLDDDPRPGRKQTSSCDKNVMKVEELIRGDRRLKVREIALQLGLAKTVIHKIINELGYRKVSARWVPKQLTEAHKLARVQASQELLARCNEGAEVAEETVGPDGDSEGVAAVGPAGDFRGDIGNRGFLENLITGDETWGLSHDTRKKEGLNDLEASVIPSSKKVQIATIIKKNYGNCILGLTRYNFD